MTYCKLCGSPKTRKIYQERFDTNTGKRVISYECSNYYCQLSSCFNNIFGEHNYSFWTGKCFCGKIPPKVHGL